MTEATPKEIDFEATLKELEGLVKQMESGDLGLEESLKAFERGVKLTRRCQASLNDAELRVRALAENNSLEQLDQLDSEQPGEP